MNKIRLKDACINVVDCPHSTPVWTDYGRIVLRSHNIRNGRLDFSNTSYTDTSHYIERIRRLKPQGGDLVITREAPMGEVCEIPAGLECCLGQRMVLLRINTDSYSSRFILYALQSKTVQDEINISEGTGSTVSNLRIPLLENLKIPSPPLPTQKAIAHILGTLDDKIELLRQMNETLEAMARALFKSWFVDFDPVRKKAEGLPTGLPPEIDALFPDSLEDSELGEIPKGWKITTIEDQAELIYGKALKEENRVSGSIEVMGSNGLVGTHNQALDVAPGVIIGRKGNPGFVKWTNSDYFVIDTAFYVKPLSELSKYYLFWALLYLDLPRLSSDSAVPGISRGSIYQSKIVTPPKNPIQCFDTYQKVLRERMHANDKEVSVLTTIRNSLLPKLISGDVEVKDIDKILEPAT